MRAADSGHFVTQGGAVNCETKVDHSKDDQQQQRERDGRFNESRT
jgi:hypothetical protein